jgi:predicted transcriptional regulator
MVERMELRLDEAGARRLAALAKKLELPKAAVVRMAIRQMAEREGVEESQDTQEAA